MTQNWKRLYDQPDPEDLEEVTPPANSSNSPSGPALAQPDMVSSDDEHPSGLSSETPISGEPPEQFGHRNVLHADCMASVRRYLISRGYSAGVAKTASRARQESTHRVYDSRLGFHRRWCL